MLQDEEIWSDAETFQLTPNLVLTYDREKMKGARNIFYDTE